MGGSTGTAVKFGKVLSVPEGTYNVRVYATFDEEAVSGTGITIGEIKLFDG
jgi:hypothetical protein